MELMGVYDRGTGGAAGTGYGKSWVLTEEWLSTDRTVWMRFPCAHLLLYVRSGMANLLPMRSHRNSLDMRDVRRVP